MANMFFSSDGTTQSDPLAMVMYSISVTHLIASLQDPQVWFAYLVDC